MVLSSPAHADAWMLQDLSILFPIPATPLDASAMIHTTEGSLGQLMPAYASKALPVLFPLMNQADQIQRFQVVGVRIDPPEVRLIWQAFQSYTQPNGNIKVLALDAAVHTFYQLSDSKAFLADLRKVADLSRPEVHQGLALGVHPSLAQRGWSGNYGQAFKKLLFKYVGEKNLFKITFATTKQLNFRWDFGGFLINRGTLSPLAIPRTTTNKIQMYVNGSFPQNEFNGGIAPAPKEQDIYNRLLSDSSKAQAKEPANLEISHLVARRLENPNLGNAATVDCASCHTAQMVRYWTEAERDSLKGASEDRFSSSFFNLANNSYDRANTGNVRAFGFFAGYPAISQRAINEAALVAEKLNNMKHR
jgi:hypothetical protein